MSHLFGLTEAVLRENDSLRGELATVEARLAEAQEIIGAIRSGEIDAVVVSGPDGDQVFTLQGAEYAYRALVEQMSEGAATLDTDCTMLYCNQRLSDLTRTPMEQIIGAPALNLFSAESQPSFRALFKQAQDGVACNTELELRDQDCRSAPVYISLRAMASLEPPTLCMVVTDLKHRRRNDELLAAGRLATSILESAAEAIAVCDQTGKIITVNGALEKLCGGNPLFELFDKAMVLSLGDEPSKYFSVKEPLSGSVIRALEVTFQRSQEQSAFLLLTAAPIRTASAVIGCVLTMTDITERKRAQTVLVRTERLASVGRMASTIAHEINNPLEIIGQAVYLAMTDPVISEEAKGYLQLAVVELERVAHITKQTLAFHRDKSSPTNIDLRELADGVLKFFSPRLMVRGITVEKRYAGVEMVEAFEGEIRQVISNLLSNSMDAVSNNGRILLRISPRKKNDGSRLVRLMVADTGSGIRPESLKTIFEPFFTTKEVIGTGLGLWVTKQIVEKHGAHICVRSRPGTGTVFAIDFPLTGESFGRSQGLLENQPK